MRKILGAVMLALVLLSGCSAMWPAAAADPEASSTSQRSAMPVGVFEPGSPLSWSLVTRFTEVTGVSPKIAIYYSGWHERFYTTFAKTALDHGTTVFVKMQPSSVTLAQIAAGDFDSYLHGYAHSVAAFKHPVMIYFAHEMNGGWYPWGTKHSTPAEFVAAWQHVVNVFRASAATNVIWVWTVNSINGAEGDLVRWWPGASYVSLVGVDGYFGSTSDSYKSIFGDTIKQLRGFTSKPILIAETSVDRIPGRVHQIYSLFAGARLDHVIGVVWFDVGRHPGDKGHDWRLEGDPDAIAAFKAAVRG